MFSANHWCVFATAEALLVPRDESCSLSDVPGELRDGVYGLRASTCQKTLWDAVFDRGDPRRVEMFIFEFGLATQRDGEPLQVLRLRRPSMARLLCTIDKIDQDLERTEQPGCRTTRHFQRGKR